MMYRVYIRETREILGEAEIAESKRTDHGIPITAFWDALGGTVFVDGSLHQMVSLGGNTYNLTDIDADQELTPAALAQRLRLRKMFGKSTELDRYGWEIK